MGTFKNLKYARIFCKIFSVSTSTLISATHRKALKSRCVSLFSSNSSRGVSHYALVSFFCRVIIHLNYEWITYFLLVPNSVFLLQSKWRCAVLASYFWSYLLSSKITQEFPCGITQALPYLFLFSFTTRTCSCAQCGFVCVYGFTGILWEFIYKESILLFIFLIIAYLSFLCSFVKPIGRLSRC